MPSAYLSLKGHGARKIEQLSSFSGTKNLGGLTQIPWVFHQIYYHIVWTTRERRPTIGRKVAAFLDRVLRSIAHQERTRILELGMVSTHVHLLLRAHPTTVIPRLLQRLKGASSALAAKELGLPKEQQLRWAQGYTIQTVSPHSVDPVRQYVRNQAARHPHEVIQGWQPSAGPQSIEEEISQDAVFLGCFERINRITDRRS